VTLGRLGVVNLAHRLNPKIEKNQKAEVNQMRTSRANARPPSTGSTQPGIPRLVRASNLAVITPKNRQPAIECASTRALHVSNPSAYKHCTAKITVTMNAIRPDHRCRPPIHDGPAIPGTLPYMIREEPSWTSANTTATVASQAFT